MNTIQQAHILLVDDNTDLLRLLEEQLRGAGYQNIRTVLTGPSFPGQKQQSCSWATGAWTCTMPL